MFSDMGIRASERNSGPPHSTDYLKTLSAPINLAAEKGNSRNEM